jgi:hypothetical protein
MKRILRRHRRGHSYGPHAERTYAASLEAAYLRLSRDGSARSAVRKHKQKSL